MSAAARLPRLHVVTDDRILARPDLVDRVRAVAESGGGEVAIHVRGPDWSGGPLLDVARRIMDAAAPSGAWVLINDRVDVAAACGASGVHLPERSFRPAEARRLLPPGAVVGRSAHPAHAGGTGWTDGADYAFVGTIHATPSHPGRVGIGTAGLRVAVIAAGSVPVLGIGGMDVDRARDARGAGAWGVAVIRGVWDAPDPARAVMEYREALSDDTE